MGLADSGVLIYTKAGALSNVTFANRCTRRLVCRRRPERKETRLLVKANGAYLKPGVNEPVSQIFGFSSGHFHILTFLQLTGFSFGSGPDANLLCPTLTFVLCQYTSPLSFTEQSSQERTGLII